MAYVTVPKDLDRVKNKVVLNLTMRQVVCLGIAAAIGAPFYFATRDILGVSNATTGMVILMLPVFFFALYEKNGLPLEKVLMNMANVKFIRPAERKYGRSYGKSSEKEERKKTMQSDKIKEKSSKMVNAEKDEGEVAIVADEMPEVRHKGGNAIESNGDVEDAVIEPDLASDMEDERAGEETKQNLNLESETEFGIQAGKELESEGEVDIVLKQESVTMMEAEIGTESGTMEEELGFEIVVEPAIRIQNESPATQNVLSTHEAYLDSLLAGMGGGDPQG